MMGVGLFSFSCIVSDHGFSFSPLPTALSTLHCGPSCCQQRQLCIVAVGGGGGRGGGGGGFSGGGGFGGGAPGYGGGGAAYGAPAPAYGGAGGGYSNGCKQSPTLTTTCPALLSGWT